MDNRPRGPNQNQDFNGGQRGWPYANSNPRGGNSRGTYGRGYEGNYDYEPQWQTQSVRPMQPKQPFQPKWSIISTHFILLTFIIK